MTITSGGAGSGNGDVPGAAEDEFYGAEERPTSFRGVLVVLVALVIGIVLLPSATRQPSFVALSSTTPTTSVTSTGSHPSGSGSGHVTTTTIPAPSTVHVLVANGTTVNGVAGSVTTYLGQKGYSTLTATNGLTRVAASQVYPTAGSVSAAREVARSLALPASSVQAVGAPAPVASAAGATVVVIAGPELATRFAPAKS